MAVLGGPGNRSPGLGTGTEGWNEQKALSTDTVPLDHEPLRGLTGRGLTSYQPQRKKGEKIT